MLRTLLVGILALSATAACGSKEDAPAAVPGAPAGKVVDLAGTVTATRGDQVRTLAPGGEVSADDVIGTSADGRVAIVLDHNNARWDLGPNRTVKVGESLAWTAAKQAGPAAVVKEETSTAGRHAEKTAATTTTTTDMKRDRNEDSSPSVAATAPVAPSTQSEEQGTTPPPPPPPAEERKTAVAVAAPGRTGKSADSRPSPPAKNAKSATSAGPGMASPKPDAVAAFGNDKEDSVGDAVAPTKKPEASRKLDPKVVNDDDGPDLQPKGGEVGQGDVVGGAARPSTPLEIEIRGTLKKKEAELKVCLGTDLTRVLVRANVNNGVYTILTSDPKATPEMRACLAQIAKSLKATATGKASIPFAVIK